MKGPHEKCPNAATSDFRQSPLHGLGLRLHGFGIKKQGLELCADYLTSADSMAWSFDARRTYPLPGCTHKSCQNCLRYALRWRADLLAPLAQGRLWSA